MWCYGAIGGQLGTFGLSTSGLEVPLWGNVVLGSWNYLVCWCHALRRLAAVRAVSFGIRDIGVLFIVLCKQAFGRSGN